MEHKVLIGFMGCGKSTVSKLLAKAIGCGRIDTDVAIEKEQGTSISNLFAQKGEPWFREQESLLLERLSKAEEPLVIATGGGLPIQPQNKELLGCLGKVIYLRVQPETVLKRLKGDVTRPLLQGENKAQKVKELLAYRDPIYREVSDFVIETDGLSPDEIVRWILKKEEESQHEAIGN